MVIPGVAVDERLPSILVVDDLPENIALLGEFLQPHYRVRAVTSGKKALGVARKSPQPDLILLDVMMPEMDGYEVFSLLRADPLTVDIPVIFVSALDSTEAEMRGLELGAVDYIAKPVVAAILLARINTQLELKRARDGLRDQNQWLEAEVERRLAEKQQVEVALELTRQVVEASPVVCFRWRNEADWPLIYVSENISRWGYRAQDLLNGQIAFSALIHPDDIVRVLAEVADHAAQDRREYVQEYRLLAAAGHSFWVESRTTVVRDEAGTICFLNGVINDIHERKLFEEEQAASLATQKALNKQLEEAHNQLLQSEKLASIGQLAAGVAHELNNPIGFVYSNLGTLAEYIHGLMLICDAYERLEVQWRDREAAVEEIQALKKAQDFAYMRSDISALLAESRDGLARVRKIVVDLRDFSRVGHLDWAWFDLHQGLESTLNIVWNELKYKCKVTREYAELPKVYCVLSQLNQVFMNLLVNAAQAILSQGEISVRTGNLDAEHVWISISDNGEGIPPENLQRIFAPFFTTKPVGKGTGLGLSLVYGIINRHQGRIEVESEVGKGTCFRIILPIRPQVEPEAEA